MQEPSLVAAFILQPPPLTDSARDNAKKVIADTFAANLAGASSEVVLPLRRFIEADARSADRATSPVFGTTLRAAPDLAALANGTLSAALEFDDVLSMMPGHPSAVVIPALCAAPGIASCTGADFVEAYAIGIEAGARIAQAMTLDHYKRGYHATGTLCIFSAVAALARLERLTAAEIDTALGIAASMASGIQGNFGTMVKPLHSGWAARNALTAVQLARAGLTANPRIFEVPGGFFEAYGSAASSFSHVQGFGQPWILDEPGITLKLFPCCYANHRAIDAAIDIRAELKLSAADIRRVECLVPIGGLIPLKFARPANRFESLFSQPYALCVALLEGHPRLSSFTEARLQAPDIAPMLEKITVAESELCVAEYPDYASKSYGSRGEVRLVVETVDGRRASRTVRIAPGHPDRAVTWAQMQEKFADGASVAGLTNDAASQAFAHLKAFEQLPALGEFLGLLVPRT